MPAQQQGVDGHGSFVAARRDLLVAERGGGPVVEAAVDRALARLRRGWARLEREDDVEARVREQIDLELDRPRRRRIALRAVGVLALVVLAAVLWSVRPQPPPPLEPPVVTEARNPLPVPWYDGTDLYVTDVKVRLFGLGSFVADGDGVVVRLDGQLQRVDADGDVSSYTGDVDPDAVPDSRLRPPDVDLNPNDRVLQSVVAPDGVTLYLVELYSNDPEAGTYLRLSETGQRVFVVCRNGDCIRGLVDPGARLH
jgi:hypothetical protein